MKKEIYERTELDIMIFDIEDVIMTSDVIYEEDELPFFPSM